MAKKRLSAAACLLSLASLISACGDDAAPPPGVSGGGAVGGSPADDAGPLPGPRPIRPDAGPRLPSADEEVIVPFEGPTVIHLITLDADLGAMDVVFHVDTTQSIIDEIDALQEDLDTRVVPELTERVADVSFGVARFEDFPQAPYGFPGESFRDIRADVPFQLLTAVTSDLDLVRNAVAALDAPLGFGGDLAEAGAEALYQLATGEGYGMGSDPLIAAFEDDAAVGGGTLGGVGFRPGALHVVLHVTDARSHTPEDYGSDFPNTHTLEEAAEALKVLQTRVIGIVSKTCDDDCDEGSEYFRARADLELLAFATDTVAIADADSCPTGVNGAAVPTYEGVCPFVFDIEPDGSGLSDTLIDAIVSLVDGIRFSRIHCEKFEDPVNFIERIVAVVVPQEDGVEPPTLADLLPEGNPDSIDESFVEVAGKARLGFEIHLNNSRIAPGAEPQSFRLTVQILGDDLIVATKTLRIVVPAQQGSTGQDAGS